MTTEELTRKVIELDEQVARQSEQIKTCFNQIAEAKDIADSTHKLALTVEKLVYRQESTEGKVDKMACDIDEIKERPAKRWDTVTTVCITAIVTAIITYILTQLGLK